MGVEKTKPEDFETFDAACGPQRKPGMPDPSMELWAKTDGAALMRAHAVAEERLDRAIKSKDRRKIKEAMAFCEAFKISTEKSLQKAKVKIQEFQDAKLRKDEEAEERYQEELRRREKIGRDIEARLALDRNLEARRQKLRQRENAAAAT